MQHHHEAEDLPVFKDLSIAEANQNAVVVPQSTNFGEGTDFKSDEIAIPYLKLLQSSSPEVKAGHGVEGDIYNTVTWDVSKAIAVIPCYYKRQFVEWRPKSSGGGVEKFHSDSSIIKKTSVDEKGKHVLKNGNQIVETAYYFVLTENFDRAIITMSATKLKKSRQWNSMIQSRQIIDIDHGTIRSFPIYSHSYVLSGIKETAVVNGESFSWANWKIELKENIMENKLLLDMAINFRAMMIAEETKVLNGDAQSEDDWS